MNTECLLSKRLAGGASAAMALWMAGMAIMPVAASAEERATNEVIEEVVVTGTRRPDRTVTESLSPIDVVSGEQIERQGYAEDGRPPAHQRAVVPSQLPPDRRRRNPGAAGPSCAASRRTRP